MRNYLAELMLMFGLIKEKYEKIKKKGKRESVYHVVLYRKGIHEHQNISIEK